MSKLLERSFTKRGMTVMTNARFDAASVTADKDGICLMVGPEGKEPGRAPRRDDARGHRPRREHRGHRPRDDQGRDRPRRSSRSNGHMRTREPHVYAIGDIVGGLWLAHTAGHEGLIAAHVDRRRGRRPPDGLRQAAARDVLPARDRLDRPDRGAGQGRRHRLQGRQGPVPGHRQGDHRRRVRGLRQGHRGQRNDDTLGVHIIGPHATDLIAEASLGFDARGGRRGRSARRPTRTRHCPRSSARRRWPSTAGPSTSEADAPRFPRSTAGDRTRRPHRQRWR